MGMPSIPPQVSGMRQTLNALGPLTSREIQHLSKDLVQSLIWFSSNDLSLPSHEFDLYSTVG